MYGILALIWSVNTVLLTFQLCQDVLVQLGKVLETYDEADSEISERSPTPMDSPPNGHLPACTTVQNGHESPTDPKEKTSTPFSLTPEAMVAVCAVLSICTQRLKKQGTKFCDC